MYAGRLLIGEPVEWLIAAPIYVFLGLLLACWFAFRAAPDSRLGRWRWLLLAALAWSYLTSTPAIANRVLLGLESRYAPPVLAAAAPTPRQIVVLSSGDPFDATQPDPWQLDLASLRRTRAAVEFWQQHGGELIFAGTQYPGETRSVAARMAALAVEQGVPRSAVHVTPGATTFRSLEYLREQQLLGAQFFLITSAVHMPRAMAVARAQSLDPIPVPCDYRALAAPGWQAWLPNNSAFPVLSLALHEIVGSWYYRLRGRI